MRTSQRLSEVGSYIFHETLKLPSKPSWSRFLGGSHPRSYLVRIDMTDETKHNVCIDNCIYPALSNDSDEPEQLSFSFDARRACAEDNSTYDEIDDVRRVLVQLVYRK